jgi:hypothetical protein
MCVDRTTHHHTLLHLAMVLRWVRLCSCRCGYGVRVAVGVSVGFVVGVGVGIDNGVIVGVVFTLREIAYSDTTRPKST